MATGTIKKGTNYAAATLFFAASQASVEVAENTGGVRRVPREYTDIPVDRDRRETNQPPGVSASTKGLRAGLALSGFQQAM